MDSHWQRILFQLQSSWFDSRLCRQTYPSTGVGELLSRNDKTLCNHLLGTAGHCLGHYAFKLPLRHSLEVECVSHPRKGLCCPLLLILYPSAGAHIAQWAERVAGFSFTIYWTRYSSGKFWELCP